MNRNYRKLFFAGAALALAGFASAQSAQQKAQIQSGLREFSSSFRENKGQWDPRARFLAQLPGLDYWVTSDGITVDQYKRGTDRTKLQSNPVKDGTSDPLAGIGDETREGHVVQMHFVGANLNAPSRGAGKKPGTMDFYSSKNHMASRVNSYSEAYMSAIYPGVHVRHYQRDGKLRYDIVIEPGRDPNQIVLSFNGADSIGIKNGTVLEAKTSLGSMNMADLHVYQPVGNAERLVSARWVKSSSNTVKFELGSYDPRLPIIVDPHVFGSYLGSDGTPLTNADEVVSAISAETNGDLYMTGVTSQTTFPVNAGAYGKFNVQGIDAFLCKMDGNAYTVTYAAILGGTGTDRGFGISFAEDSRALWVGGTTNSTNFAGATNTKGSGTRMWFSKFTFGTGGVTPEFVTYLNDAGDITNAANGSFKTLRVSKNGTVYVVGNSIVSTLLAAGYTNYLTNNSVTTKKAGFVLASDATGATVYKTMIAGREDVVINGASVNKTDELICVGFVNAANTEDTATNGNPTFTTTAGVFSGVTGVFESGRWLQLRNAVAVKLSAAGTGQIAFTLGGAQADDARAVAYDNEGNIFITGFTNSFNFQRTPGAFQQDLATPQVYVTKLNPDASEIQYSTGLRTNGVVFPTAIAVDGRGNAYVGGVVAFQNNSPFPGIFVPSTPGQITTTLRPPDPETAIDPIYNGGDSQIDATGNGDVDADIPSTTDGFLTVLNPAGSALQYSSYIGEGSEDRVTDVFVDSFGGCWVSGFSQVAWNLFFASPPDVSDPNGIGAHITANAFKTQIPTGGPAGGFPFAGSSNGWVVKHRVVLPRLTGVSVAPTSAPGGFGATSTVTVSLEDPAPVGGVEITLTTSNAGATSWDPDSSVLTTTVTVLEGNLAASATIYTLPVVSNQVSSIKAILDNDFKETRLTILPWLVDMSVSPLVTEGGNNLVVAVNLSDFAPAGGVPVVISTDRPDLVLLPNPAEILVLQNAKNGQITIPTAGVDIDTVVAITASFLGVNKTKNVTLKPAKLKDFTFSPSRVNRGDDSTATVRYFGKTGIARILTISQVSGDPGALVNGQALPTQITVPAQTGQVAFTVTAPLTLSAGFITLKADDGSTSVNGTLNMDPIDILDLLISPATDVTAGTVLTGQVTLTRPAGPNGLTVNVSSSNPNAGTLSTNTVTIAPGQTTSSTFEFQTAIVPTDTITNIHATKTGFVDKFKTVTVRGIKLSLTLNPSQVDGGFNSRGYINLSLPAPVGGLKVTLSSSNTALAYMNPTTVTVPEGETTLNFPIFTRKTPVAATATITATGSALVKDSKVLKINPPSITGFSITPTSVLGGSQAKATLTFSTGVPAGTVVQITGSPSTVATLPATVAVTAGSQTYSFFFTTKPVATTTVLTVTAKLGPSTKSATLIIRSPGLGGLTFSPTRVVGTNATTGKITLDGPAPAGGIQVTMSSDNPSVATVNGNPVVTIPAGSFSATFPVKTFKVSRTVAVKFTATSTVGVITGTIYVDP